MTARFARCVCFAMVLLLPMDAALATNAPATKGAAASPADMKSGADPSSGEVNQSPPTKTSSGRQLKVLSSLEFWLSILVLIFGCIVLTLEYLQLRTIQVTAEESLRIYAVTLIIVATLFSITAGFDAIQVAPAMGLFGTIAGYLLGKRTERSKSASSKTPPAKDA